MVANLEECHYIKTILNLDIMIAMRGMGSFKDWSDREISLYSNHVLEGFLARKNKVTFASIVLFFKMWRARLYPCNPNTYGVNPLAILDTFDVFCQWQKEQVAVDAQRNTEGLLSMGARSQHIAQTLKNAPQHIKQAFIDMRIRLEEKERGDKEKPYAKTANLDFQKKRLFNCLLMMGMPKKECEAQFSAVIKNLGNVDGDGLKAEIDKMFPPNEGHLGAVPRFGYIDQDCTKSAVTFADGDNRFYKINSGEIDL